MQRLLFRRASFFTCQSGEHTQALQLYLAHVEATGQHDFEILHRLALGILDYGFRSKGS